MRRICVTGAAGFIGHWLARFLKERGYWVRAVDYREPRFDVPADETDWQCDLRSLPNALRALRGIDQVYALAADMGGMGFISRWHYDILKNNALINLNTAQAAEFMQVGRLLFTSSACTYPVSLQASPSSPGLAEDDAWAGRPDSAYGVEKLFTEELYGRLAETTRTEVRIARFHNIYGIEGAWAGEWNEERRDWDGGREKAPSALCRKVAVAKLRDEPEIEIWGDGRQRRTFCEISDCLEMLYRLMESDHEGPLNIGSDFSVSIDELVDVIARTADVEVVKRHIEGPEGVRGRNADLSLMRSVLGYESKISLEEGIARLYPWVEQQVHAFIARRDDEC